MWKCCIFLLERISVFISNPFRQPKYQGRWIVITSWWVWWNCHFLIIGRGLRPFMQNIPVGTASDVGTDLWGFEPTTPWILNREGMLILLGVTERISHYNAATDTLKLRREAGLSNMHRPSHGSGVKTYCTCVVVWIRTFPIVLYIWMLCHQGMSLFDMYTRWRGTDGRTVSQEVGFETSKGHVKCRMSLSFCLRIMMYLSTTDPAPLCILPYLLTWWWFGHDVFSQQ